MLTAKAVMKPQMVQFAPSTASTIFGELMEKHDSVSGTSQCLKELHEQKVTISD
jgi:hypothetical protein